MAASRDIKLEEDDVFINTTLGDFEVRESDTQHVKDIINAWAGWWKEFPTLGVGVKRFLGSPGGVQRLKRLIQVHLKSDGYRVDKINIIKEKIYITGERI